jgi:clan AA aspartic protease
MGSFKETITLTNGKDDVRIEAGLLKEARSVTVGAVVDTGASTLVINEEIRRKLGLEVKDTRKIRIATGALVECQRTEPVEVRWQDRDTACPAIVMPGDAPILLGAIPLEDMDLMIDPVSQRLVGVHGDQCLSLAL